MLVVRCLWNQSTNAPERQVEKEMGRGKGFYLLKTGLGSFIYLFIYLMLGRMGR